jgi:signal transduction histidine kinase
MKRRASTWLAWGLYAATLFLLAVGLFLGQLNHDSATAFDIVGIVLSLISIGAVGAVIAWRQPRNAVGWILLAIVLGIALADFGQAYGRYSLVTNPGSLPGGVALTTIGSAGWPAGLLLGAFLFPLFPNGRPASPRWGLLVRLGAIGYLLGLASLVLAPGKLDISEPALQNPIGLRGPFGAVVQALGGVGFVLILATFLGGLVSAILRFRRSRGEERQQLKWFAFATVIVALAFVGEGLWNVILPDWARGIPIVVAFLSVPAACAIAILKYHLYDLDVVINKTLVYTGLAAFITAVYVAIVVGIGAGIGNKRNLGLSILATAVVAVAFQPVRDRVQHLANRLVYGERATPYEVLSEFSERMSGSLATEDLLPRMARILGEGTGASRANVWLKIGTELKPEAAWPSGDLAARPISLSDGHLPPIEGADKVLPVTHQGELLGALSITKSRGDPLRPAEEKLAEDLASQAGLVLRNVRLTEELLERLRELQASRQRIVAAQDEERRKLERNLHDGAQQQLVALQVKLSLAERLAEEDCRVKDQLSALRTEAGEALENLRDLARGIYPPLLADQGLMAALQAQARKATFPVTIEADGIGRYPQDAEAAVYFCCLEALQNVAKYANATEAIVRVRSDDSQLSFSISDDGVGFDPSSTSYGTGLQGMADRLAARGGQLSVTSSPGQGAVVEGWLPIDRTASDTTS